MDPWQLVIPVLTFSSAVALGLVLLSATPAARMKRAMRKLRTRKIAKVRDGTNAVLIGKLEFQGEPLVAPITGRPCAIYELIIEKQLTRGGSAWETVVHEIERRDFLLRDPSGTALVRASSATPSLALDRDAEFRSGWLSHPTPEIEAQLKKRGVKIEGLLVNCKTRCYEAVLEESERVVVAGLCHREPAPAGEPDAGDGYRDGSTRLVIEGGANQPLMISDERHVIEQARPKPRRRKAA